MPSEVLKSVYSEDSDVELVLVPKGKGRGVSFHLPREGEPGEVECGRSPRSGFRKMRREKAERFFDGLCGNCGQARKARDQDDKEVDA